MIIQLLHAGRSNAADLIRAGTLDLALGVLNSADESIAVPTLRESPYVCLMRSGHPCAKGRFTVERYLAA